MRPAYALPFQDRPEIGPVVKRATLKLVSDLEVKRADLEQVAELPTPMLTKINETIHRVKLFFFKMVEQQLLSSNYTHLFIGCSAC